MNVLDNSLISYAKNQLRILNSNPVSVHERLTHNINNYATYSMRIS